MADLTVSSDIDAFMAAADNAAALTSLGGIGGSAGATDNAVLRADGIGAATVQTSTITVSDAGVQTIPVGGGVNVYATFADASNYALVNLSYSGGVYLLSSSKLGTGTEKNIRILGGDFGGGIQLKSDGNVDIEQGGVGTFVRIGSAGMIFPSDNTYDIGASGATRPRAVYVAGTNKGTLTTNANATTGLTAGVLAALTNATLVITDGTGQVYRVPCII